MTEEDIISGCWSQMRGSLQMKSFTHRLVPNTSMDELILSTSMRKHLECIINFEKARAVLLGQLVSSKNNLELHAFFGALMELESQLLQR